MSNTKIPWSIYALMTLLLVLGLGGIGGGIAMLADPSGGSLDLPEESLKDLFISDFFWPGVFLIVVMGLAPYGVCYGIWKGLSWARASVMVQGILLLAWIIFQFILWGDPILIQIVYLIWGIVLLFLAFLPSTKAHLSR